MFIRRKSNNESQHRYSGSTTHDRKQKNRQTRRSEVTSNMDTIQASIPKPDLVLNCYPLIEYGISLSLFLFFIYLTASLGDISWGFFNFSNRQWWQFIVIALVLAFSIAIMFNSDCETIVIFKKRDEIIYESSKCFCLFKNIEIRSVKNLKEIHIVVCGAAKKVSLHTRWYGNNFMFSDCSQMLALRCISEQNAQRYRQAILKVVQSEKKILS